MACKRVRHILELSKEEKEEFRKSFDFVISDCDSVLWYVFEPIKGVAESLQHLQDDGKKFAFISNNSVRPLEGYMKMFEALKIAVKEDDIIHPAISIVRYLKSIKFEGLIYCIGTEIFKNILRDAGFELFDGPQEPLEESIRVFIKSVHDKQPVKAVVVDMDFNLSYAKLVRAQLYLKNDPECKLIIGATDQVLPITKEFQLIGPGSFVNMLLKSSVTPAVVLGKPGQDLSELLLKQYKIKDPNRVLFIGDMIEQDIGFGNKCGFQKMLVLTGGATKDDLDNHKNVDEIPDYYADSFSDFITFYNEIKN